MPERFPAFFLLPVLALTGLVLWPAAAGAVEGDDPAAAGLMEVVAAQAGGPFHVATSGEELTQALFDTTVNSFESVGAFAGVAVPSSRTGSGASLYNAWFESSGREQWVGHLEAYGLAPDGTVLDKDGGAATDPVTGLLVEPHNPYWDAGEVLKTNASRTLYTTDADGNRVALNTDNVSIKELAIDSAPPPERCDPIAASSIGLAGFTDSICVTNDARDTPPPLPASPDFAPYPNSSRSGIDSYEELQTAVIDFTHGKDAFDQDGDGDFTEMRSIVLGDIFHSTPLVIGQPTRARLGEPGFKAFRDVHEARDRVVYVGANDGMLHGFDAGDFHEGDDPNSAFHENGYYDQGTGAELFGYVPRMVLDELKLLTRNNPRSTYYVDAPPVGADVWLGDGTGSDITKTASEWATVVISGLREGGPGYLALDVTDPAAGDGDAHGPYPLLLWEFTHAKLGESWSEPVVTRVKVQGESSTGDHCGRDNGDGDCREQWVAIFGAGYERASDPNHSKYEGDPRSADGSDVGKAIFMVAVDTGEVLASVEFGASGPANGTQAMKYAIPSNPAVLDVDFDGFADVVYVGDLGGQMWKWDIHTVGTDVDADDVIDNWTAGVFFRSEPATLANGDRRYRSIFAPPAASFVGGVLKLAFGTGEREELHFGGDSDPTTDENNRFYVVTDPSPIGSDAFDTLTTEADLFGSDVTDLAADPVPGDAGFFFTLPAGGKIVTDVTIFAGLVIVASYSPASGGDVGLTLGGGAFLHVFGVDSSLGFFGDPETPPDPENDRKLAFGVGLPSNPRVSLGRDPTDDRVYVKTSTGQIVVIGGGPGSNDGFGRSLDARNVIYWRQIF